MSQVSAAARPQTPQPPDSRCTPVKAWAVWITWEPSCRDNYLGVEGAKKLAAALEVNTGIRELQVPSEH